ncbi:unnamed protein product, partial [Mesorhabditis spiculigera]
MRINHLFENFSDVSDPAEGVRIGAAPPTWLSGNFLRNGPGKFKFGDDEVNHWFDGMAYPQRYHFENGRMLYSAKFLKSHAYLACEKDKRLAVSTFATPRSVQKNMKAKPDSGAYNCLVNFLQVNKEVYALTETSKWLRICQDTLEVQAQEDISNHVAEILSCSAHPIRDRDGTVTEPTCFRDALFWKERQYVNIILVDKKTGNRHPRKFFAPPFFTFHHANAFERDGFLYVDFCLVENPGNFEDLLLQHMRDGSFSSRNPLFRPFLHRIVIPTNVSGGIILVPVMSANQRKKPIFMILDAKSLREICRYVLPVPRIPMGFHAIFVDAAAGDKEN